MKNISLRKHANIRLLERCQLSPHQLIYLIENHVFTQIGIDSEQKHNHLLIYSEKDDECFVIIQDQTNNEIITILTTEYHNAWQIHPDAITLTKTTSLNHFKTNKYPPITKKPNIPHNTNKPNKPNKPIYHKKSKQHDKEISKISDLTPTKIISLGINVSIPEAHYTDYPATPTTRINLAIPLIEFPASDLFKMNFPKNLILSKKYISQEYSNNPSFTNSFNLCFQNLCFQNLINQYISDNPNQANQINQDIKIINYNIKLHEPKTSFALPIKSLNPLKPTIIEKETVNE
jgi:hypothetical protein